MKSLAHDLLADGGNATTLWASQLHQLISTNSSPETASIDVGVSRFGIEFERRLYAGPSPQSTATEIQLSGDLGLVNARAARLTSTPWFDSLNVFV
jgi:hypothetical protein